MSVSKRRASPIVFLYTQANSKNIPRVSCEKGSKMTKLDRLNSFLSERLSAAVSEIMLRVSTTIQEYEEESARIRKENEYLRQMLKNAGRTVTDSDRGVVLTASPGKENCSSGLEQETEPQQCQNQHLEVKEEDFKIKTEQPPYPTDPNFECESRTAYSSQADYAAEPNQCMSHLNAHTVDQSTTEDTKVKLESQNTDNMDTCDPNWSLQPWEPSSRKSNECSIQHGVSQFPCGGDEGARSSDSAYQNRPAEFRAPFSYSNQIVCTNRPHCTSKHCEMQKRTIAKSSPVWKYFSLKEGDCSKAVCLICRAVISRGVKEFTTSALLKHLRLKHGKC